MPPLDLNLLTIFDTLYEQRSVTRAAERLGLTQSAVSHALRRLRDALGDPLFVRTGRVLQPTVRATNMAGQVREGLARLHGALTPESFDPVAAQRRFTIAAGSYFCALIVPRLIAMVCAQAPGVAIRIVPVEANLLASLDEGSVDLALGVFERVPARLVAERLFREELVWVAARDSDLAGRVVSAELLLERPRLQIGIPRPFGMPAQADDLTAGSVADTIARRSPGGGVEQDVGQGMVYDARTAISIVGETDLVALVPRRIVEADGVALGVVTLDIAESPATLDLFQLWHRQADADPGLTWLRTCIASLKE